MKNIQFAVFNTDKRNGQMNTGKAFYPADMTLEERTTIMNAHKIELAHEVGFEKTRLFMTLQGKERGTSYTLKKEDIASYKDLYDYDVYGDIVKMTPGTAEDKTAIGFNVLDGANVVAMNLDTMEATSTFCAGAHINSRVPEKIVDVLGGDPKDIMVDISPFAYYLPVYNKDNKDWEPAWVSDKEVWEGCLRRQESGVLYINQYQALMRQLVYSGIELDNIHTRGDSYFDSNYYSSQRARMENDPSQDGRFMHGVAYVEEGKNYNNSNIRVYQKSGRVR